MTRAKSMDLAVKNDVTAVLFAFQKYAKDSEGHDICAI